MSKLGAVVESVEKHEKFVLDQVKRALETGNFAVEPDVRGESCTYCDYDVVCRVGPRLSRKRN